MKEISPEDKKYRKIMKYVLITFSVMMLITLAVIRIEDVAAFCGKTWVFVAAVLKPIIFGVLFAVLLNPLTEKIEGLFCKVKFLKKRKALTRVLAVVLAILLVFLVLSVIIAVLMSVVTSSVQMISVDSAKKRLLKSVARRTKRLMKSTVNTMKRWLSLRQSMKQK
jgi:predicted PurR-regulated permease PerM